MLRCQYSLRSVSILLGALVASAPLVAQHSLGSGEETSPQAQALSNLRYRNIGPANISERVLREVFCPPFERAVKEARVGESEKLKALRRMAMFME